MKVWPVLAMLAMLAGLGAAAGCTGTGSWPGRAAELAAGGTHTCALTRDGRVFCWGSSDGIGPSAAAGGCTTDAGVPDDAGAGDAGLGLDAATDVDAGTSTAASCAVVRPVLVDGVTQPTTVVAGGSMSCAIGQDRSATCWGTWSELAGGACAPTSHAPTHVGLPLASAIALGGSFGCVIALDGSTHCFGADEAAQLGRGAASGSACAASGPMASSVRFESLALGARHACGVDGSRRAWCWGDDARGALGRGVAGPPSGAPTAVASGGDVSELAAGDGFTCGLSELTGRVSCWGRNDAGQLGAGASDELTHPSPTPVDAPVAFTFVAAGAAHACALASDGSAWCWGLAADGQLGSARASETCSVADATGARSARPCSTRPVAVDGSERFASLALGASHTCAVRKDDTVLCWGRGAEGQLGAGTTAPSARPRAVGP